MLCSVGFDENVCGVLALLTVLLFRLLLETSKSFLLEIFFFFLSAVYQRFCFCFTNSVGLWGGGEFARNILKTKSLSIQKKENFGLRRKKQLRPSTNIKPNDKFQTVLRQGKKTEDKVSSSTTSSSERTRVLYTRIAQLQSRE